jgi:outer membrane protein assembly factor BamB
VTDSHLVFGWYDVQREQGSLLCYDPKTLALHWERRFEWPWDIRSTRPTFSIIVDGEALYVLAIGRKGENLFRLRVSDGQIVWARAIEKYVYDTPLLLHNRKLLVHSVADPGGKEAYGHLQAIRPDTGETLWRVRIEGEPLTSRYNPPLVSGNRIYLIAEQADAKGTPLFTTGSHLYTIDLKRGVIVDKRLVPLPPWVGAPFAESGGILYFGGGSRPTAFDLRGEKILWQLDLEGQRTTWERVKGIRHQLSPDGVLDPSREELYLGDSVWYLYVLSAKTGAVKEKVYIRGYWRREFRPIKAFFASYGVRRLALYEGLLFVGTPDGSLFVFRPKGEK